MKTGFLFAISIAVILTLTGCVATPVYDRHGNLVGSIPAARVYVNPAPVYVRPYRYDSYYDWQYRHYNERREIKRLKKRINRLEQHY